MTPDLIMVFVASAALLSYWFSHISGRLRLPSVVLLVVTGVIARIVTHLQHSSVAMPPQVLPVLGTAGLVLIVLEGALDLHVEYSQRRFVLRTLINAVVGLVVTTAFLSLAIHFVLSVTWLDATLVATPFSIISSAVAIPSAQLLGSSDRSFVVYESSWSDILGVMLFNAILVAVHGGGVTFNVLAGGIGVALGGAIVATAFYWLVGHMQGHVKFAPLLFAIMLVYAGADAARLSPLLMVLIVGLALNNAQIFRRVRAFGRLHSPGYEEELVRLKHVTAEASFVTRTFFFLALGYNTDPRVFADLQVWLFALVAVMLVFGARVVALSVCNGRRIRPLVWLAPRGLITATLYLGLPRSLFEGKIPPGTLVMVVLLSCIVMVLGMRFGSAREEDKFERSIDVPTTEAGAAVRE